MKPWLASIAAAALIAGSAPSFAQTSSTGGSNAPTASQPSSGTTAASPSAGTVQHKKSRAARHTRTSGASTARKSSPDDQMSVQLNREELQRLQQSSR